MHSTHRRTLTITLLTLTLLLTLPLRAQPQPLNLLTPEQTEKIEAAVTHWREHQNPIGLAVGIIYDNQIVNLKGYGLADRENKTPVTRNTLFRWASISKPVTVIAAMQLVEQNKLDLDADVRTLVPEFPEKPHTITPRQLLSHQSGIVHYRNGIIIQTKADYETDRPYESVINSLDMFKESPLISEPGTTYNYSTHGYILLSAAVERAGQQPYWQQVQQRIVQPLELKTLQPDYPWVEKPNRAVGYRDLIPGVGPAVPSFKVDVSYKLGGGGYISNIDDLTRFTLAIMKHELVTPQTSQMMWMPQKTKDGTETQYGLGFQMRTLGEKQWVAHGGSQQETRTFMAFQPDQKLGLAVMSNSEWFAPDGLGKDLADALTEIYYEQHPEEQPVDNTPTSPAP